MGALRHLPPHTHVLSLQHLPGAIVCIHKHQPSDLNGYTLKGRDESGRQPDSFIRPFSDGGLGSAGRGKLYWQSTAVITFWLIANLSLLSQGSSPVTGGGGGREEIVRHQTRPFDRLLQVSIPRGKASLMFDPLFFNSRIAESTSIGTQ